jgi:hypothetical protein
MENLRDENTTVRTVLRRTLSRAGIKLDLNTMDVDSMLRLIELVARDRYERAA